MLIYSDRFNNGWGDNWSWMPRYATNNPVYSARKRFVKFFALVCGMAAIVITALADNPAATVNVNANANRHAISPLIYGANWTDQATLSDLNLTANRRGGNATSTYNWQINAANRAGDWFFESLGESDGSAPSAAPDAFITSTKAGGAQPMITIPMLDWLAKLGPGRSGLTPYSIAKYGPQTGHDPYWADAGNGIGTNAATGTTWTIRTNNPNDAYVPNSSTIQQQWVQYLTNKFGNASGNGVKY
ncbi:MAG TPA: glycoside hydrolase family 44 protein, partial [Verrucomicrobiae bacterium]